MSRLSTRTLRILACALMGACFFQGCCECASVHCSGAITVKLIPVNEDAIRPGLYFVEWEVKQGSGTDKYEVADDEPLETLSIPLDSSESIIDPDALENYKEVSVVVYFEEDLLVTGTHEIEPTTSRCGSCSDFCSGGKNKVTTTEPIELEFSY